LISAYGRLYDDSKATEGKGVGSNYYVKLIMG